MSAVLGTKPAAPAGGGDDVNAKLQFSKKLQTVTNKIHSTSAIDEIILEISQDVCELFEADRLSIYILAEDKNSIVTKVKTGLNAFKDIRLPISDQSIAGYVALSKKMANIADVYDERELRALNQNLKFMQAVDKRTGYRTKQQLAAPILDAKDSALIGVVQIINSKADRPFSKVAEEGLLELTKTLAIALRLRQKPNIVRTKYDYLVADAVISAAELDLAARSARKKEIDIEKELVAEFQVKLAAIGASLSKFFGVPYEPFNWERIKPIDLLKNLKRDYVESCEWLPIDDTNEGLILLTPDPEKVRQARTVGNVFPKHSKVLYRVTTNEEFIKTINQFYGEPEDDSSIGDMLDGLDEDEEEGGGSDAGVTNAAEDNELVKLVNRIIIDAYNQGASDIHIEPYPGKGKTMVRFRKDGSLQKYVEVPSSYRNALTARLKIMCDLDISEKRRPQDGKIKFKKFGPLDIELRVASIPSAGGVEDVVMRILAAGTPIPLDKLGLSPHNYETIKKVVSKPYGLFFVCGPTGSGKTTTLHSVLSFLNTPDTKIWTAEDPVEITQAGLRQVQVNKKAGLDFATVMKAFLRADPDIIMVGEMRDKETASTGIEASLTGHLVLATLHTNSAPESIIRLLDMGMDPFNFADALLGVLAQRLAKRLCSCKEEYHPDQNEMKQLLTEYCEELQFTPDFKKDPKAGFENIYKEWITNYGGEKKKLTMYRKKGCDACRGNGYKGRVGLHELMVGTDDLKKNIMEKERVSTMFTTALSAGMRTLKMDGIEKVLMGHTDMAQVRAVCIK
jgi:type II secretory ATPase GspE/PulE/Tfp pilus assembly ATPase PilB-like protein